MTQSKEIAAIAEGSLDEPEIINLSTPENVLLRVFRDDLANQGNANWQGFNVEHLTVISGEDGVMGAASYEEAYGGFLDYTVTDMVDCPKQEGWFVVVGITAAFQKGDGWLTDDDIDFDYETIRPATEDEKRLG